MRAIRHYLSNVQYVFFPPLWVANHSWIGLLHRGVRWTESGPLRSIIGQRTPVILCMWHQDILTSALYLAAQAKQYPIIFMISDGRAASLGRFLLGGYGYHFTSGSRHQEGGRVGVMEQLALECERTGHAAIVTGDGSRGPANEARWGAVYLARDTGLPIVAVRTWFSHAWLLPTWARTQLPWPLPVGHAHAASAEPLYVAGDADKAGLESSRAELERRLNALIPVAETESAKRVDVPRGLHHGVPRR